MDQHPIPQDVTGFQFKLIGSMTVKQFGFVAAGVITGFITYYLPLPGGVFAILFKMGFIPAVGISGFIIAFLPIDGRPIDVMATNFAKALLAPNQYVYHKDGREFSFSTVVIRPPETPATEEKPVTTISVQSRIESGKKEQQLQEFLLHSRLEPKNKLDEKEMAFLEKFSSAYAATNPNASPSAPAAPGAAAPQPYLQTQHAPTPAIPQKPGSVPVPKKTPEMLNQQEIQLEQKLEQAKQEESQTQAPEEHTLAHQKVLLLENQVKLIHQQKVQLEQELAQLKKQLETQKQTPPSVAPAPVTTQAQSVQQAPKPTPVMQTAPASTPVVSQTPTAAAPTAQPLAAQKPVSAPIITTPTNKAFKKAPTVKVASDTPNVIIGTIKDSRGNILANMLVEVKDTAGNPVRAFKSNTLGQFASATPLANGSYTIEVEDPKKQHTFEKVPVIANGQILQPIEITSHDEREQLRQELFS